MVTKICLRCKELFDVSPCEESIRRYCSLSCRYGNRIIKRCLRCKEPFEVIPKRETTAFYCSLTCYRPEKDIQAIIGAYRRGKSCAEIGIDLGLDRQAVLHVLRTNNEPRRKTGGRSRLCARRTDLSSFENDMIVGLLLGDGYIGKQKGRRTSHLSTTTINHDFAIHLSDLLPFDNRIGETPAHKAIICGRMCDCKRSYRVETVADLTLEDLRQKWYPDGKKIIPSDLVISPIVAKYWFYGDGSTVVTHCERKTHGVNLSLCTQGFTCDECDFLSRLLWQEIGAVFHVYGYLNDYGNIQCGLMCCKKGGVNAFLDYIGDCHVRSFWHKWKRPTRAWPIDSTSNS
jgi:hypothetical protein